MAEPRTASYGSWASPITSDLIVASTIGLGEILLDGDSVYWLETRPQEGGRTVVVRRGADGSPRDVTPPVPADGRGFNTRTRVHEYGDGVLYFCNDADQRLYRQQGASAPLPITPAPPQPRALRYADGVLDRRRDRMIWVCEDHTTGAAQPVNTLVAVPLDGAQPPQVLVSGADFYAAPRLSPDGTSLAWLEWRHPNMPWDGTELWVGRLAADGAIADARKIAGGATESVFQPEWSPDGVLYFVSDRSGWWNLYRDREDRIEALHPQAAEFGAAQWTFRLSRYAFAADRQLICSYSRDGADALLRIDLDTLAAAPIAGAFTDIASLRAAGAQVYFRGASPTRFAAIVRLDLASGATAVLRSSNAAATRDYDG